MGKKNIKGDHVFLTGAGSGIGRGMAIKLGRMGCKLSISDINLASVQETKDIMVQKGIPAEKIFVFHLDVSKSSSVKEGAEKCRQALGDV